MSDPNKSDPNVSDPRSPESSTTPSRPTTPTTPTPPIRTPRAIRRRRLLIVLAVLVGLGLVGFGLYRLQKKRTATQIARLRTDAIAAVAAGQWEQAVEKSEKYFAQRSPDPDLLAAYAEARLKVPAIDGSHLGKAISALRGLLQRAPESVDQRRILMKLLLESGLRAEALDTADRLLRSVPNDPAGLRVRAIALMEGNQLSSGLEAANAWSAQSPQDLEAHAINILIRARLRQSRTQILGRAAQFPTAAEPAPGDPRSILLRGLALRLLGERDAAVKQLIKAADALPLAPATRPATTAPSPDDAGVMALRLLISELDRCGQYGKSEQTLRRLAKDGGAGVTGPADVEIKTMLLARLWEIDAFQEVADLSATLQPADRDSSTLAQALWGLSLLRLGQKDQAKVVAADLAGRKTDALAIAWAAVIENLREPSAAAQKAAMERCQFALRVRPGAAYLRYYVGDLYDQLSEVELALSYWSMATAHPAWGQPWKRLAGAAMSLGDRSTALLAAQQALDRLPGDREASAALLTARAMAPAGAGADVTAELIQEASALAQGENTEELITPLLIGMHLRRGDRAEAARILLSSAESPSPRSEAFLLRLADTARLFLPARRPPTTTTAPSTLPATVPATSPADGLPLAGEVELKILDRCQRDHGMTPALAFARALSLLRQDRPDEARTFFESSLAEHNAAEPRLWKLATARYYELVDAARARAIWAELGDAYPGDLLVQKSILSAASMQAQRATLEKAISRLRELGGPQSILWRVARARWLMDGAARDVDLNEAVALLDESLKLIPGGMVTPAVLEIRLLLGNCYRRLGKLDDAVEQLTLASAAIPAAALQVEIADLLLQRQQPRQAIAQIRKITGMAFVDVDTRRRAAMMLAGLGEMDLALDLAGTKAQAPQPAELILCQAMLYNMRGEGEQVLPRLKALLAQATPEILEFAADFVAAQGRGDEGRQLLERLGETNLSDLDRQLVTARFESRFGGANRAIELCKAITNTAPSNTAAWSLWVGIHLNARDLPAALQTAGRAAGAVPTPRDFRALLDNAGILEAVADDPRAWPLIAAVFNDPPNRQAALDGLAALKSGSGAPAEVVDKLRPVADGRPMFLPLQMLTMRVYDEAGQRQGILAIARRTMLEHPAAPEVAQLAAELLFDRRNLDDSRSMAEQWRRRAARPLAADVFLANLDLDAAKPAAAMKTIAPYLDAAKANPDALGDVLRIQTRGLVASRKLEEAAALLNDLLRRSRAARSISMAVAGELIPALDAADDWLIRAAAAIPEDSSGERLDLARARIQLAGRFKQAEQLRLAHGILVELGNGSPPPQGLYALAATHELAAATAEELEQQDQRWKSLDAAETIYRRYLATTNDDAAQLKLPRAVAQNNLAMILAQREPVSMTRLQEAGRLLDQAIVAAPRDAELRDSMAYVARRAGNYDGAIESARTGISLAPQNVGIRLRLVEILLLIDERNDAARALEDARRRIPDPTQLPKALKARLEKIEKELAAR